VSETGETLAILLAARHPPRHIGSLYWEARCERFDIVEELYSTFTESTAQQAQLCVPVVGRDADYGMRGFVARTFYGSVHSNIRVSTPDSTRAYAPA